MALKWNVYAILTRKAMKSGTYTHIGSFKTEWQARRFAHVINNLGYYGGHCKVRRVR